MSEIIELIITFFIGYGLGIIHIKMFQKKDSLTGEEE